MIWPILDADGRPGRRRGRRCRRVNRLPPPRSSATFRSAGGRPQVPDSFPSRYDGGTVSVRITALTDPDGDTSSYRLALLGSATDRIPVGAAFLRLFTRPGQEHLAELDDRVHPAERRKHAGSLLLDAAVAAARQDGRRSVITQAEGGS